MKYRKKQDEAKVSMIFVFHKLHLSCTSSVQYLNLEPSALCIWAGLVFLVPLSNKNVK